MSSKINSVMKEYSVLELLDEFNFFVPEIQREYVWGQDDRNILSAFCDDIIDGKNTTGNEESFQTKISKLTAEKKYDELTALLAGRNNGEMMNIGFLYSYEPNYKMEHFPDSDVFKDTYLIDGQQRFTSLFLILFYLALKEGRIEEFKELLRYDYKLSNIAFDYRVRTLTHDFVIKLLNETTSVNDINSIKKSIWFVNTYILDPTIEAMINGLRIIKSKFETLEDSYYDYIIEKIKFWHFKTEKTNQGEELYITMNSRGKQLEENETVRAKLFEKLNSAEQVRWSEKWENWQDFFWKHRGANENADIGFNEFLKCIAGLQSYLAGKRIFVPEKENILDYHILSNLSLETVDSYFKTFQYIRNSQNDFTVNYKYDDWLRPFSRLFDDLIFREQTNWFVDFKLDKEGTERKRLAFMWSILYYCVSFKSKEKKSDDIFRFCRIIWLRYNNSERSVESVKNRVEESLNKGIYHIAITDEEEVKHSFFLRNIDNDKLLREFEYRIWKIEDHRLNLNGTDVANKNSSHLIYYKDLNDYSSLDLIYEKFISLFPNNLKESEYDSKINDALMFYGFYGVRRTPLYYHNYEFGSWRRIVRDLDSEKKSFSNFFNEFNGQNLQSLLELKKSEFLQKFKSIFLNNSERFEIDDLVDTICVYIILCKNIWINGRFIAYEDRWSDIEALTTFEKKLSSQTPHKMLYNTKGNFRGYGYSSLLNLLPEDYLEVLRALLKTSK